MTVSTKKIRLPLHGVLLLDKSAGHSSNDVLIKAKRLLNAQKAGHTGTLDPFATGLLPLCFGEATKFAQDLLDASKTYDAVIHLGIVTSTGDTEGERMRVCDVNVTATQVEAALTKFRGDIRQVPPMYSALKRDGKPLYEYAREGITLEREARAVSIHSLECIEYKAPYLTIRVSCSKGTYIRVLGEDIGEVLGCGGHLHALRRTGVGALRVEGAHTLASIEATPQEQRAGLLAPVDTLLSTFSPLSLTDELARRFLHGQRLALGKESVHLPDQRERMRVYRASDGKLLGTAQLMEFGVLAPERLIVA